MIDWSELVADAAQNLPKNEAKDHCSDLTDRNKPSFSENVGTPETRANAGFLGVCSDVPSVPHKFERQRVSEHEKHNQSSFTKPAGGGVSGESAPHKTDLETSCQTCAHIYRPGLSDGHCGGREDLPHAYTPGHPLRQLPSDGGKNCSTYETHESLVAWLLRFEERRKP